MKTGRLRRTAAGKTRGITAVFIHEYGGSIASTRRHQNLLLELGFDTFAFALSRNTIPSWTKFLPKGLAGFGKGIIEHWAVELETALESLNGPKIIFSLSFPSATVPALLSQDPRRDVRAWICDGGPFADMASCQWNLFSHTGGAPNPIKRAGLTLMSYLQMGGPYYNMKVRRWVGALDPRLPILSIRAGRDALVPPRATDRFFAANPALNLHKFLLPEAEHLLGLKSFPELYRARVADFLQHL